MLWGLFGRWVAEGEGCLGPGSRRRRRRLSGQRVRSLKRGGEKRWRKEEGDRGESVAGLCGICVGFVCGNCTVLGGKV